MKAFIILATTFIFLTGCETLNQTAEALYKPSSEEIASGLKQALEIGTGTSARKLSARNGYLENLAIKILFPPEARKAEQTLRRLGFNKLCDEVIQSLNRAAEDAATEAKPIFISAIRQMTIRDASDILLSGKEDAATLYFKRVTSQQLREKFNPIIAQSLNKVGATRHWSAVITRYNQIPMVSKINPDLNDYVTQKAVEGLFYEIAREELQIRQNITARKTLLLQKVFDYADRQKSARL